MHLVRLVPPTPTNQPASQASETMMAAGSNERGAGSCLAARRAQFSGAAQIKCRCSETVLLDLASGKISQGPKEKASKTYWGEAKNSARHFADAPIAARENEEMGPPADVYAAGRLCNGGFCAGKSPASLCA